MYFLKNVLISRPQAPIPSVVFSSPEPSNVSQTPDILISYLAFVLLSCTCMFSQQSNLEIKCNSDKHFLVSTFSSLTGIFVITEVDFPIPFPNKTLEVFIHPSFYIFVARQYQTYDD